ncbi:MAG: 5'-3' exonuclease H3TH domain-containing protein [Nostocoides sp.]
MPDRLLLLDAASLYFRAFYGVPDQRRSPGEAPTNAIRGFLDMIATLISQHAPTHLAACWDNDWRPPWRVALIPSYKAHRVAGAPPSSAPSPGLAAPMPEEVPDELSPQVPLIVDALTALGIVRVGADGYEADDVIGTLCRTNRGRMPIDIVTGDRDLFQLVDDAGQVRVLYTARSGVRDAAVVDEDYLARAYGVPNGAAYLDMSILRGDASDGLPGVRGIGEKTAAKLISTYGTLAALLNALDAGDPQIRGAQRTRLEEGQAYLAVAPKVVAVAGEVPLPASLDLRRPTAVADPVLLSRLAHDYGLTTTFNRVLGALGI